jgi:hypothetical protein
MTGSFIIEHKIVFIIIHNGFQPVPQSVIIGGMLCLKFCLLKSSIVACYFVKIFFPLASNISTFG